MPANRPILVLVALAAISGFAVLTHRPPPRADLVLWCFAESHAHTYREPYSAGPGRESLPSLIDQFSRRTTLSARVELVGSLAEDLRLMSLFMSDSPPQTAPDLCEIEIGSIGKFFQPPVEDVGLLPLNDYLRKSGQADRLLKSRLATWSKRDPQTGERIIFGIPHDVHPVTISYRKDLFDQSGVELSAAKTWPEFQDACLKFQAYWSAHGHPQRRAIEMSASSSDTLIMMLLQRHCQLVDVDDQPHLTDAKVAATLTAYAKMVAGPAAIGAETQSFGALWARDFAEGDVCALCTPDWRASDIEEFAPQLSGHVAMMPLPRFDLDDAPTSAWGGTMIGIPKSCPDPDHAWKLLEFLYLSPQAQAARISARASILPAIPDLWKDPRYHRPDPFFSGQKIEELYIQLARQIPVGETSPYSLEATIGLARALYLAQDYVHRFGTDGLGPFCAKTLRNIQADLRQRIKLGQSLQ